MTGIEHEGAPAEPVAVVGGRLAADAGSVPVVRAAIVGLALAHGAGDRVAHRVALAVTEATSNVVLHAYPYGAGEIDYAADVEPGDLQIVISDEGEGIREDEPSDGLGMGLGIIAQVASDFRMFEGAERGLSVWMRSVFVPC
jgi:anti-sigma regulatory factor (Ser/Thr protein kinase)